MLYRLKSDLNGGDPDHHHGEPVTIVRRAMRHLDETARAVVVQLYTHDDGRAVLDELARTHRRITGQSAARGTVLDRITIEIHGTATPMWYHDLEGTAVRVEGGAAQSLEPAELVHDEART